MSEKALDLTATLDEESAYIYVDFVIITVPTNYDPQKNSFDCSSIETMIEQV